MVAHAAPKCLLVCETKNRTHLKIGSCCPRLVLIFHSAAAARRVALSWNCKMKMESRDGFGNSPLPNLLHIFRIGSKLFFRFLICVQIWFLSRPPPLFFRNLDPAICHSILVPPKKIPPREFQLRFKSPTKEPDQTNYRPYKKADKDRKSSSY